MANFSPGCILTRPRYRHRGHRTVLRRYPRALGGRDRPGCRPALRDSSRGLGKLVCFSFSLHRRVLTTISFLDASRRIASRDYNPTDDDILRARLRTLGVQEHDLSIDQGRINVTPCPLLSLTPSRWQDTDVENLRCRRIANTGMPLFRFRC